MMMTLKWVVPSVSLLSNILKNKQILDQLWFTTVGGSSKMKTACIKKKKTTREISQSVKAQKRLKITPYQLVQNFSPHLLGPYRLISQSTVNKIVLTCGSPNRGAAVRDENDLDRPIVLSVLEYCWWWPTNVHARGDSTFRMVIFIPLGWSFSVPYFWGSRFPRLGIRD